MPSMAPLVPWPTGTAQAPWSWTPVVLDWLQEPGSITARLRMGYPGVVVTVVDEGLRQPHSDECAHLNLAPEAACWVREVVLHQDTQRLVHARTVVPHWGPQNAWAVLQTLGRRPLGEVLFQWPGLIRGPLCFNALHPTAVGPFPATTHPRAARRRVFWRDGAPLLLTEAFDLLAQGSPWRHPGGIAGATPAA